MCTGHFESDRRKKKKENEIENSEISHCIKWQELTESYDRPCLKMSWRKKMILIFKHLP